MVSNNHLLVYDCLIDYIVNFYNFINYKYIDFGCCYILFKPDNKASYFSLEFNEHSIVIDSVEIDFDMHNTSKEDIKI